MNFGNNLKKIRLNNELTQEELARKINVSRSNIANYENNKNMPSVDILVKLSMVFHCSIDYLIGEKTTTNKKEELEKRLYHFNLTEEDYNSAIKCFMNNSKNFETLELSIQYCPISDKETEKQRNVLLEISEFVNSFIPQDFVADYQNKKLSTKDLDIVKKIDDEYYKKMDEYLNEAKKNLLSLDKSKIIHNYKKDDLIQKIELQYGENSIELLDNYNKLNSLGKAKIEETAEDCTKIPKYTENNESLQKTNVQNV